MFTFIMRIFEAQKKQRDMEEKEKLNLQEKYHFSGDPINKIEHSIDVIRKAEPLVLQLYDKGLYLCSYYSQTR